MTFEQLIVQQRPSIERVIHDIARRYYLASTEIEAFRAVIDRALERNDYELLRAFEGKSTWDTYLQTVIMREFFVYQASVWGDWRPTAAAMRAGSAAMLLEELVVRDRFSLPDAVDWMRTTHRVDMPRHKLLRLAEQIGIPAAAADRRAAAGRVDDRLQSALCGALAHTAPDDRLVLELRFRDHHPLTRIAAVMHLGVRQLQRRIDAVTQQIRAHLVSQGLDVGDIEALLGDADSDVAGRYQSSWDFAFARPSREGKT